MADAIQSVRPDLNNFYASLSDEAKGRDTERAKRPSNSAVSCCGFLPGHLDQHNNLFGDRSAGCTVLRSTFQDSPAPATDCWAVPCGPPFLLRIRPLRRYWLLSSLDVRSAWTANGPRAT